MYDLVLDDMKVGFFDSEFGELKTNEDNLAKSGHAVSDGVRDQDIDINSCSLM